MAELTEKEIVDLITSEKFKNTFLKKFDRSGKNTECWLWTGKPRKNEKEYVSIHIKGKKKMDAHRVSLIMKLGKFPEGDAAHREEICRDNKHRCANPEHLDDSSKSQNRRDENTAKKTKRHKNQRKENFKKLMKDSSKAEKESFYKDLYNELFTKN